jgi:outer membrane murein-binding lipoprotein Lpp
MIKKVAVIALVIVASLLVAGCTSSTNSNQAASSASQTASSAAATKTANNTTKAAASASAKPSASALIMSPTPAAVPTKQCTHVEIIIFHNMSQPSNTCTEMKDELSSYYVGNQYVTITMIDSRNPTSTNNGVVGQIKETGFSHSFDCGDVKSVEAWTDSVLTCK